MINPTSPQNSPYKVKVEKGKTYSWCSCGLSKKQPFCDSSHRGGAFKSVKYLANSNNVLSVNHFVMDRILRPKMF